jgi:hypothetical protein
MHFPAYILARGGNFVKQNFGDFLNFVARLGFWHFRLFNELIKIAVAELWIVWATR